MTPIVVTNNSPAGRASRVALPPAGVAASISVSANVTAVSVARGLTTPITYTLSRTNYTGTVTPAVTGLPADVTGTWSDSSLTGGDTTTVLTLSATGGAGLVTNDPFVVTFSGTGITDVTINSTVSVTETVTWTAGPGANAPSWIGKTTYPIQQFATPLPVHFSPADANGYKGFSGFPNAGGAVWFPTRVEYPTVATPLGTQPVFQLRYPGQVENITTEGQTTTVWRYAGSQYTNAAIRITGTWTGTLSFETSTDGVTWTAKSCFNRGTLVSQTSTTVNSPKGWEADTSSASTLAEYDYLRVRASAPMTGTARISVGMQGGQSPANASFGNLTGDPTRIYFRMGFRTSADWSDNNNTGTKLIFFSQRPSNDGPPNTQQTNHYVSMTAGSSTDKVLTGVNTQWNGGGGSNRNMPLSPTPAQLFNHGEWHDLEVILHAGTAGNSDGIAQVWVDGVQTVNESNVQFFSTLMTPKFTNFWFDPTFGGGSNPSLNQTVQIAQWYYESAP
jgi:hypothetical protein